MPWGCGAADGMTPLQHVVNFAIYVQESSTQHAWLKSCLRTWRQPLILRFLLPQNRLMPSAGNCCSSSENLGILCPSGFAAVGGSHSWPAVKPLVPLSASGFLAALQQGFPLAGWLPPCEGCATTCSASGQLAHKPAGVQRAHSELPGPTVAASENTLWQTFKLHVSSAFTGAERFVNQIADSAHMAYGCGKGAVLAGRLVWWTMRPRAASMQPQPQRTRFIMILWTHL